MAGKLITSLLSRATNLLPTIRASVQAPPASSSNSNNSERERAHAVEDDLEKLMRTLKRIKATLYDAEEREIRDHSVKLWLKELKMVSYDAEDLLSEYRYEVTRVQVEARKASRASGSQKGKQMEYIVPMPAGMVDRLNKIRIQFDEIAKDREALQLREDDGVRHPNNKISGTPTGHMVDEASIFGRGSEITEVINFLLSEKEKSFSVISIVGKGGLGKTTIAQLVYKDRRVSQCFDLLGWVCVSEEFDVRRLIKATIESVFSKIDYGLSELSPLQKELAKTVKEKTILLVLDDVWNENQSLWELFQVPSKEAKMVRILVTTRNKKVTEVMQTTICFSPTNLPEDSCWQLFRHYAFSGSYIGPMHLVDMGWEIMRKCGGLPLAVKSIASLLRHETDEEGWRKILESDLWESNPSNDIFPALQISYAHLPIYLKPCLLFCSTYPKDYILEKNNLIELWISHGYVESRGKRKITEIGVEYYEELKERSFLDDFLDRSSECCKLHDIIYDLARLNSENEHYSVEINQPIDIQAGSVPQETYHLFARGFVGYINQFLQQNLKGLRTLSMDMRGCTCGGDLEHQYCIDNTKAYITSLPNLSKYYEECWGDIGTCNLTKFEALRVLELNGYSLTKIPHTICQLKHLAYLGIISFRLKVLPLSIGLLYNLQTLILDCPFLEYLPESIGDLSNLMRLVIKSDELKEVPLELINLSNLHGLTIRCNWIQALPNTIGYLSSLEELNLLPNIVNHKHDYVPHGLVNFPTIKTMKAWLRVRTIAWLKDMKDLEGKLYVEGLGNMNNLVDIQCANLRNKCKLETLELCWKSENYEFASDAKSYMLLNCEKSDLRLSLVPEEIRPDVDISPFYEKTDLILGCIPTAAGVGLVDADDVDISPSYEKSEFIFGLIPKAAEDGFVDVDFALLECLQPHPNLKKLLLSCYPSATLSGWMRDPSSFQSIQEIRLQSCTNIKSLPFNNLHSLKHLNIQRCYSLQVLQFEQLSSQLEKLHIAECHDLELITGLGNLNILATLEIYSCIYLKSLIMDGLQLVESTKPLGDSSHEKPYIGRQSIASLRKLEIRNCLLLCVLPDGLIPSGPSCYVNVNRCGCPDFEIGHLQ